MSPTSLRDDPRAQPFDLGGPGRTALLLHGFSGSPFEVRPLGEALSRRGYRAVGPVIAGHGDTPEALAASGRDAWLESGRSALDGAGRDPVHLVGLSLGGMIAILLARDNPERVASLTLLAPAAQFSPPIRAVFALFRRGPASWVLPFIPKNRVGVTDPDLSAHAPMLRRIPTGIIGDVLDLMDDARKAAHEVQAPTFVAMGALDATVDNRAIVRLARSFNPPPLKILRLAASSHLLPLDVDSERLCKEVGDFIVGQDQLKG